MPAASPTGRVEGARRAAPDVVDRCLHRPTPSKHPYRPFAARLEAAADRHRVASTATRLLRLYEATTRATTRLLRELLRGYYERGYHEVYYGSTTGPLRGFYYEATTWPVRGYYEATTSEATTRLLPGYYEAITRLLSRPTPESTHATRP